MSIIRLDLGALVKAGSLSAEEAARLAGLALPDRRGGLLVNVLLIFGALAVAAAAIALVPDAGTGLFRKRCDRPTDMMGSPATMFRRALRFGLEQSVGTNSTTFVGFRWEQHKPA